MTAHAQRIALALALLALGSACRRDVPLAVGTLERDRIELTAEANEPIAEIATREGETVKPEQLLVRLDTARVDARVAQMRGARDQAKARLAETQRGPRSESIAQARARLAGVESELRNTRRELARVRALAERDYASKSRKDELESQFAATQARREEAQAQLDAMLTGSTQEELLQAQSALAAAEAALAEIEVQRSRLEVRAPVAGVVDALPFEAGERPPAGAVVVVLLADSAPYARVYVPENVRASLDRGATAEVMVDGHAEPFSGRVRTIARDPSFTPYFALTRYDRGRLSYIAEIDLGSVEAARLPSGVPVEVRFHPAATARDGR